MNLKIPATFYNIFAKEQFTKKEKKLVNGIKEKFGRYQMHDNDVTTISTSGLPPSFLEKMKKIADENVKTDKLIKTLSNQLTEFFKISNDYEGIKVKSLKNLQVVIEQFILSSPHHYLFSKKSDGTWNPHLVIDVTYTPPRGDGDNYVPAHTEVKLSNSKFGSVHTNTIYFNGSDIPLGIGITAKEALQNEGYEIESEMMMTEYETWLQKFKELRDKVGLQLLGRGKCYPTSRWSDDESYLDVEGIPTKIVVDELRSKDREGWEIHHIVPSLGFYSPDTLADEFDDVQGEEKEDDIDDDDYIFGRSTNKLKRNEESVQVPEHPYIRCFNLKEHYWLDVHIINVEVYKYDPSLRDKLVLPEPHKRLIDILSQGTEGMMDDIISGKSSGVIVISTGAPGTGKTLTAEVYSEVVQKPLYVVQSSQLGIDVNSLEKELKEALQNATRWKAILLIDEADVYVRTRGDDLVQNAVVGVFLRVLEYYKGILFMTSNRETVIDDAILSRATAHIRYSRPDHTLLSTIWKVHSKEFGMNISDTLISHMVTRYSNISGRDVRNILKLAFLLSKRTNQKVDETLLNYSAEFQDLPDQDNVK
jgi:hypothetical protein